MPDNAAPARLPLAIGHDPFPPAHDAMRLRIVGDTAFLQFRGTGLAFTVALCPADLRRLAALAIHAAARLEGPPEGGGRILQLFPASSAPARNQQ